MGESGRRTGIVVVTRNTIGDIKIVSSFGSNAPERTYSLTTSFLSRASSVAVVVRAFVACVSSSSRPSPPSQPSAWRSVREATRPGFCFGSGAFTTPVLAHLARQRGGGVGEDAEHGEREDGREVDRAPDGGMMPRNRFRYGSHRVASGYTIWRGFGKKLRDTNERGRRLGFEVSVVFFRVRASTGSRSRSSGSVRESRVLRSTRRTT